MMKDLSADNVFYKRRVEELGQKLQEQNELIISQKQQVRLAGWGSALRAPELPGDSKHASSL